MLSDHKVKAGRSAVNLRAKSLFAAAAVLLTVLLPAACAGIGPERTGGALPLEEYVEKPSPPVEEHRREDDAFFKGLPAGVRAYLLKLSAAFATHDAAFLLAQGEGEYEKTVRNRVEEEEYLAMLYRAGGYADDAVWEAPYELNLGNVTYIDYTAWREQGPALGVDGNIYLDKGRPILFSMKVLWRLNEPKLLGVYP
jgi:hypothetical protein